MLKAATENMEKNLGKIDETHLLMEIILSEFNK